MPIWPHREYALLLARAVAGTVHLLLLFAVAASVSGCGRIVARELSGTEVPPPADFSFVGEMSPCYLVLRRSAKALRVNCFHLDGVLHIHSSRWAKLPRFSGENWTVTVRREPDVRVQIDDAIYSLRASPIDDDQRRVSILHDRGYWYAWEGITVVRFEPVAAGTRFDAFVRDEATK